MGLCNVLGKAGYLIAVVDIEPRKCDSTVMRLRDEGIKAFAVPCDITSPSAVAAMAQEVLIKGDVTVVVNNAGKASALTFERGNEADWLEAQAINLNGAYFVTRNFLPHMQANRRGVVINVASLNGRAAHGNPAYGVAKANSCSARKATGIGPILRTPRRTCSVSNHMDINQILTARARAGVAFDRALVFVTGGYAGVENGCVLRRIQWLWRLAEHLGQRRRDRRGRRIRVHQQHHREGRIPLPAAVEHHLLRLDGLVGARAGRRQPAPRRPQLQVLSSLERRRLGPAARRRASGPANRSSQATRRERGAVVAQLSPPYKGEARGGPASGPGRQRRDWGPNCRHRKFRLSA